MTPFAGTNRLTSPMGPRRFMLNGLTVKDNHIGNDIVPTRFPGEGVPESAWQVRECSGGVVAETGYNCVEGNFVRVKSGSAVVSSKHLKSVSVKKGQTVKQGDVLGIAGSTGQSGARHLHLDVKINGNYVDPSPWTDIPNRAGTYKGNNTVEGPAAEVQPQTAPSKPQSGVEKFQKYNIRPVAGNVNFRAGPGLSYASRGHLGADTVYTVLEEKNGWGRIALPSVKKCSWVCLAYTKKPGQ